MEKKKIITSILWFVLGFALVSSISVIGMQYHWLVILLFLIIILGLTIFFRKELSELVKFTKWYEAVVLFGISLLIHGVTSYIIITYLNPPVWNFDSSGVSFLLLNDFYIWAKPMDVFIQQLLINLLVLRLHSLSMNINQITKLLLIGFGGIHILQILRINFAIGLMFIFAAIMFSFVFPRMILKVKNGYIYNFMIHLAVYNIAAIVARMLY